MCDLLKRFPSNCVSGLLGFREMLPLEIIATIVMARLLLSPRRDITISDYRQITSGREFFASCVYLNILCIIRCFRSESATV